MMRFMAGLIMLAVFTVSPPVTAAEETPERARAIARGHILIDTHIDVPYRLQEDWEDVTQPTRRGEFDLPRAVSGGLDIPFMSIYTPAEMEATGGSFQLANRLIDSVEAMVARAPGKLVIVRTPEEAEAAFKAGKVGLALGMENGSPLESDLAKLRHFHDRGISYITLAHSLSNHLSDSSYDENRPLQGLSEFGREAVLEMNRVGMMVDISHVSDQAFFQVLEISRAPVIASHSSARHFTPDFERNMSDEMIVALAKNGGVIQINFGSSFVTHEARMWADEYWKKRAEYRENGGFESGAPELEHFTTEEIQELRVIRNSRGWLTLFVNYALIAASMALVPVVTPEPSFLRTRSPSSSSAMMIWWTGSASSPHGSGQWGTT